MSDTAAKLAEHYRKLAAEEVAMAKLALTNEARARHYAKAAGDFFGKLFRTLGSIEAPDEKSATTEVAHCSTSHLARAPEQDRGHKNRQQARRLTKQGAAQGTRCPLRGSGPPPKRCARRFSAGANCVPIASGMGVR
jgi:hypothetical protein